MASTKKNRVSRLAERLRKIRPVNSLISRAFMLWYNLPVPATHYYSPLPDPLELEKKLHRWHIDTGLPGIDINLNFQKKFLLELSQYRSECTQLPSFPEVQAMGYGQGYGEVEAQFLYSMIRYFKPRKIIEVGSGVSTFFSLHGMEKNRREEGTDCAITCVEPYPTALLRNICEKKRVTLFVEEVQNTSQSVFSQLTENDILFIDSSHVSKMDSDVNYLYLEVLPRLNKGVIIRIHDIYFPYLAAMPGHPVFRHSVLWNEAAMVRAFLCFNAAYEILLCQSYFHYREPDLLKSVSKIYDPQRHFPSSLWLRKVA